MRLAGHDTAGSARTISACTGAAVTVLGLLTLLSYGGLVAVPLLTAAPSAPAPTAVAGLCTAGAALLLLAAPRPAAPRRRTGYALAALAAAIGTVSLLDAMTGGPVTALGSRLLTGDPTPARPPVAPPAAALAVLLVGIALVSIDTGRLPLPGRGGIRWRITEPLLAVAATIAMVALVPGLFAFTFPPTDAPGTVMSPLLAMGVLAVSAGAALARPHRGPLATATGDGPAAAAGRRLGTAMVALPFAAAAVSAVVSRSGVSRPAAAVSTGAVLAGLGLVAVAAHLVRSLEAADRRQRELVAALRAERADGSRAEQALAAHAAEVERSNEQLRHANQRLESALAFKSDLVSMLSHDVAQPVSSIASLAELLTEDWTTLPDEIRRELAMKIDKNTRRLIDMLNDLTLLFRLDAGSVTARRTPVPVREVVERVVEHSCAGRADVGVRIPAEVSALADRGQLRHIVQNLLSNALRYGAGPVEIRAWQEPEQVVLHVEDHGRGVPEELVPKLFDRFDRGAGMGLFIVRHLVEANGGSVRYERAEPHGARLVVTLEPAHATVPAAVSGAGDRVDVRG